MSRPQKIECGADSLLAGLHTENPRAQHDFWKQTYGDVHAISTRILGPGPDASDVAADVMSDFLLRYVHRLNDEHTLLPYLSIMTTRRALRFRDKKPHYTPLEMIEVADETTTDPEEAVYLASMMPRLERCMERLTPKAQEIIRLRYYQQMTNENIGHWVGGSKQYIGRVVTQGIAVLRKCLNRHT